MAAGPDPDPEPNLDPSTTIQTPPLRDQTDAASSRHSRASSSTGRPGSSASGLKGSQSKQDRIDQILERGLNRALTRTTSDAASQPTSTSAAPPRMEPLLGSPSRRRHDGASSDDDDDQPGLVLAGGGKTRSTTALPNYQGTSMSYRRSTASNTTGRTGTGSRANAGGELSNGSIQPGQGRGVFSGLKEALHYFGSVELENKGSVARDHLALERTFLAWLRTSVSFASVGIAVTQLFRLNTSLNSGEGEAGRPSPAQEELRRLGKPLGATFLAISILILFLGYARYVRGQKWVMAGRFPASRGTVILVTLLTFAVMVASLAIVIVFSPGGW